MGSLFLDVAREHRSRWSTRSSSRRAGRRRSIFVDIHAEATSEKVALARWLDGKVTAVIGTHTHVQTNDARVQPGGTAALTDAGMTGPARLGDRRATPNSRSSECARGMPVRFETATGDVRIEGALIECDASGRAGAIELVRVGV